MSDRYIKLTREELYEKVWCKPTMQVAEEFGMSDVAVAKICKKLNIPKPSRGYWRQIQVGEHPKRIALPKANSKVPKHVFIDVRTKPRFKIVDAETLARVQSESDPANRILVTMSLRNSHPLVSTTRKAMQHADVDDFARLSRDRNCLDVRVSRKRFRRALLIMNALVKAIETRDCSIEIVTESWPGTHIVVGEEKVKVYLWEKVTRIENREPPRPGYGWQWKKWVATPTGKLSFVVEEHSCDGVRKRWSDGKQRPLEEQLNDVMAGIWTVAEALRVERVRREEALKRELEAQHRREEEERLRKEEEGRRRALEMAADSWIRSQNLHTFLRAYENIIGSSQGQILPDTPDGRWLVWARQHADRLDPFKNGSIELAVRQFCEHA